MYLCQLIPKYIKKKNLIDFKKSISKNLFRPPKNVQISFLWFVLIIWKRCALICFLFWVSISSGRPLSTEFWPFYLKSSTPPYICAFCLRIMRITQYFGAPRQRQHVCLHRSPNACAYYMLNNNTFSNCQNNTYCLPSVETPNIFSQVNNLKSCKSD